MEPQDSGETEEDSSPSSPTTDPNPNSKPNLRKEPSFNRWCGDAPLLGHSPSASFDGIVVEDSVGFELPLIQNGAEIEAQASYFRQRSTVADHHLKDRRSTALFDVEIGLHPSDSRAKLVSLESSSHHHHHHPISVVSVLKTGFFILIWYTISTCLTLYNKTLLGDKLGKFPAPLLMNTFHFGLQAVLSKVIVCFQHRAEGSVQMTWRDYFTKVVPTALGTALDVNLSNASLVFI